MNAAAVTVFAFFGLVIVALNGIGLTAPRGAGIIAVPQAVRGWLAVGVVMLLAGGGVIAVLHPTSEQIHTALGIFAVLVAGVLAKWLWDATLRTPFQLEVAPLMGALVVTPIVALAAWNLLSGTQTLQTLLLCFSNGFFWQTVFSDVSKREEIKQLKAQVPKGQQPAPRT